MLRNTFFKFIQSTKFFVLFILSFLLVHCKETNDADIILKSPSGKLKATFQISKSGELTYFLTEDYQEIINSSLMGLKIDNKILGRNVKFGKRSFSETNQSYKKLGVHALVINKSNDLRFEILDEKNELYFVEARSFDDGFAYRYIIPGKGERKLNREYSSWNIPQNTKVWFFERDSHYKLKSYAGEWKRTSIERLDSVSNQGPIQGKPLILEFPGNNGYGVISEAALYDYSGMRLESNNGKVSVNFTEGEEGFSVNDTIITPWRVTLFSKNLNGLVNSDVITNLNPEFSKKLYKTTDYIKPGKSVWRWWHKNTGNPEQEKKYIEYANLLNFEYTTIDEGWGKWKNKWKTIKSLVDYGNKKGVGVFVWKHSKELNLRTDNWFQMRSWLDSVQQSGAVGIKVDFMNSEAKEWVDFEIELLKESAKRTLLVNFHGCHPPTGESRTYPNEITREGIRGIELNRMEEGPIPSSHNATLPFTRFVIGSGDYTPLGLTAPGPTTWAHQVATTIAFTSPYQAVAEDPSFLLNNELTKPLLPFLKELPTVWDETIVLPQSKLGEIAILARRSGDVWYIAALNGENEKNISIDYSFLEDKEYQVIEIKDDFSAPKVKLEGLNAKAILKKNNTAIPFKIEKSSLTLPKKKTIHLASGGGFVSIIANKNYKSKYLFNE